VAALASDATLDRYNDLAYRTAAYRPSSDAFREYLFPFEETAIERFFPPPPARLLLGGAGGGREAFALADMGYSVVAFEPAATLASELAARKGNAEIEVHRGAYEDMDELFPASETFDAAIIGWGSFSHLRNEGARIATLESFRRLTNGPILVSFLAVWAAPTGRVARLRRILPRRTGRDSTDIFAMTIGLYHPVDEEELRALSRAAGLRILHLNFDERETSWPHAVLTRDG
jgi:SAM-dependent methyltransferase